MQVMAEPIVSRHFTKKGAHKQAAKLNQNDGLAKASYGGLSAKHSSGWSRIDHGVTTLNTPFRKYAVVERGTPNKSR